ncbi:DNA/RNA non-specific endonuclease [Labedella populi]|uniref:DNA/RNA non-specific endonuclease n=1 Tax=Labedella populi TaxID=2498850 RepID=A0A3S5CIY6_9MICO|nr:DNA/RNA non-specific endonuclease [Labedella populi]RWZ59181.1 DNA/RNA non-specific endonuclease [Labedella populi]
MTIPPSAATPPSLPLGYDEDFLAVPLPLPRARSVAEPRILPYTHFTVALDPDRRLAAVTGVNIDGARIVDVGRGDDWHLDDRIPAEEQTGPAVYARNDLDRGHLVRRRDPVWGEQAEAVAANIDTFCYTNAAPQAAEFNQGKELWVGLEDHVLAYAEATGLLLSVFTGPVLGPRDPLYRGTRIPLQFWKIAAWTTGDTDGGDGGDGGDALALHAAAFLLDQTPQLSEVDLAVLGSPPPLGPFRTFQVSVADVGEIADLDVSALADADVLQPLPAVPAHGARPSGRWRQLRTWTEITLRSVEPGS